MVWHGGHSNNLCKQMTLLGKKKEMRRGEARRAEQRREEKRRE